MNRLMFYQTGNTTTIRCSAVRENDVSWHHGGPIQGLLKPVKHHSTYMVLGNSRGAINLTSERPSRTADLTFFQSEIVLHNSREFLQRWGAHSRERLTPLSLMERPNWRPALKPPPYDTEGFKVVPHYRAERPEPLSDDSRDKVPSGFTTKYKLRKLYLNFLSHWMGYDRGDSYPFDF